MARQYTTTMTQRGQVTVPADVRRLLGLKPHEKVVFSVDDGEVRINRAKFTLESVRGSVPPLSGDIADDFDAQIALATEEHAQATAKKLGLR